MEKLGKKRLGSYEDIDQDTLACRALHRLMVPTRPEGTASILLPTLPRRMAVYALTGTQNPTTHASALSTTFSDEV